MRKMSSLLGLLLALTVATVAEQSTDFSGTYNLVSLGGAHTAKNVPKRTLRFVQDGKSLEIEQVLDDGKAMCSTYELDGSESKNATWDGDPTIDKALIKGKNLVIQTSHQLPSGVPVHETQKWELSSDRKTLKVRREIRFEGMERLDETNIETYARQ
jgi:hypothetical protein